MRFNYYYGNQADQFSFIRIPRVLLLDALFEPLTIQAKLLYGVLLDRMGMSMRNGWLDEENRVYIIYQIAEIQEDLGFSKKKAIDFLTELEQFGLVEKKRRGRGLPSILYVKSFMTQAAEARSIESGTSTAEVKELRSAEIDTSNSEKLDFRSTEMGTSTAEKSLEDGLKVDLVEPNIQVRSSEIAPLEVPESTLLEVPKSTPLKNYNNINNTYKNNIKSNHILSKQGCDEDEMGKVHAYAEIIAENMSLDSLKQIHRFEAELLDGIHDLILEVALCKSPTMVIASNEYPTELVKSKFLKLNASHVEYAIDCFNQNTTKVRNIKKYMLAILFNAPTTLSSYYTAEVHHDMPYLAAK